MSRALAGSGWHPLSELRECNEEPGGGVSEEQAGASGGHQGLVTTDSGPFAEARGARTWSGTWSEL